MKKNTLFFLMLSLSIWQIQAQLSEDFEGSFPPADWTITDDGNGTNIDWKSSIDSFSGTKAAFIKYDDSGATEDWLISPAFIPDANNNILTFYQKQDLVSDESSTYTIRVKNITDNVDFVTIDTQNEVSFSNKYVLHSVSLPVEYNGKNIQIAFVLNQNFGDSWYIDKVSTVNPTGVVPNCSDNHSPINTETDVANWAGDVLLNWDAPTSGVVTSYRVQVGLASDALTLLDIETGNTNYILAGLGYSKTYYWKITPKNYEESAVSCNVRWFTTQIEDTSTPINDSCATAIGISETPYENTQDASHATNNLGNIGDCGSGSFAGMNDGVWYTFTTITGGTVNIDITNVSSAFDVEVAVYSGTCGNFTCTGFMDDPDTGAGVSESLSVDVDPTTKYWINVGEKSSSTNEDEGAFTISLSLEGGVTLGVENAQNPLEVHLYPNPTNGILNINNKELIDAILVFNLMGQKVESMFPNRNNPQIDLSNLPSGMYIVEIRSKEKKGSYRVIKR